MTDPSAGTNRDDPPHAVSLKEEQSSDSSAELYAVYEEHSKTLRTWLVAYGIGAPVLFITNDKVWKAIASSGSAEEISAAFLIGVFLQVALAAINKTVMWVCYYGELEPGYRNTKRYRFAHWVAKQFWIDLSVDLVSMLLFGYATAAVFQVMTHGS